MNTTFSHTICSFVRLCTFVLEVLALVTPGAADEPPVSADLNPRAAALIAVKCVSCHSTDEPQGGLNLTSLPFALGDRAVRARWIRIHDRVDHGEMPPDEGDLLHELVQSNIFLGSAANNSDPP